MLYVSSLDRQRNGSSELKHSAQVTERISGERCLKPGRAEPLASAWCHVTCRYRPRTKTPGRAISAPAWVPLLSQKAVTGPVDAVVTGPVDAAPSPSAVPPGPLRPLDGLRPSSLSPARRCPARPRCTPAPVPPLPALAGLRAMPVTGAGCHPHVRIVWLFLSPSSPARGFSRCPSQERGAMCRGPLASALRAQGVGAVPGSSVPGPTLFRLHFSV